MERGGERERKREREIERDRDRERDRQTDRQREREREKERIVDFLDGESSNAIIKKTSISDDEAVVFMHYGPRGACYLLIVDDFSSYKEVVDELFQPSLQTIRAKHASHTS